MAVRGVLIRIGVEPNSDLFAEQLQLDEKRYVVVTSSQETTVAMYLPLATLLILCANNQRSDWSKELLQQK